MSKHNLYKITLSAAVLAATIFLTGCPRDAKSSDKTIPVPKISFNVSNAEALAATITSSQNRAARDADTDALLQKILEDGTVEAAMGIDGGEVDTTWSNINYVILPPENVNSSDIYLLMKDYSRTKVTVVKKPTKNGTTEYEDATDENSKEKRITKYWTLSPLICIHKDSTYNDVLIDSPYEVETHFVIDDKENIQFLKDGSVIYLCRGSGYDHFLYKWNPVTKQRTQLFKISLPEIEGSLFVQGFSISNDEDYIYMNIDRIEADQTGFHYLKIIRLSDPTFDKEIGNGAPGVTGWCYNPHDDCLYYSMGGLNKADKKGDNPELIGSDGYAHLIPQSANKIWGQDGYTSTDYKLVNFLSEKTEEGLPSEEIWYKTPEHYYFWGDYIFANNTLYLCHQRGCDSIGGHKDAIIAIPLDGSNSEPKNLLDFNHNIQLHSWDVNEKFLYISGFVYETKEPVNCKIDLKTGRQAAIQSDAAFGAIAAL